MSYQRSVLLAVGSIALLVILFCGLIGCATAARQAMNATAAPAATRTPAALIAQVVTPPAATATATRLALSRTARPPVIGADAPLQPEATATPTATPPTPSPTPTPIPTSSVVSGWLTYENKFLGYSFSYPPEARIKRQGFTGFDVAELPENMTSEEYWAYLESIYPDDLCVTVNYGATFVVMRPRYETAGRHTVPCGVTGIGDYDVTTDVESLIVDSRQLAGTVNWIFARDSGDWRGEFHTLRVNDNLDIQYGSMSGTHEEFLDTQETMMRIVLSLRLN